MRVSSDRGREKDSWIGFSIASELGCKFVAKYYNFVVDDSTGSLAGCLASD